jgi:hypothetical protein
MKRSEVFLHEKVKALISDNENYLHVVTVAINVLNKYIQKRESIKVYLSEDGKIELHYCIKFSYYIKSILSECMACYDTHTNKLSFNKLIKSRIEDERRSNQNKDVRKL